MNISRFLPSALRFDRGPRRRADVLPKADSRLSLAGGIALVVFLVFGGSGAPNPLILMALEVLGLGLLGVLLYFHLFIRPLRTGWACGVLLGLGLVFAVGQLVPLPWQVWTALPGRSLAAEAVAAAGRDGEWRPLSLAPAYTRSALLTLLPALAVFFVASALDLDRRLRFLRVTLIVGLMSAALGMVQVLLPNTPQLYLSPRAIFDLSSGVFANRNSQADFLLLSIVICFVLARLVGGRRGKTGLRGWTAVLVAFLAAATLATQSRFGLAGLVLTLVVGVWAVGGFDFKAHREALRQSAKARVKSYDDKLLLVVVALIAAAGFYFATRGAMSRLSIGPTTDSVGELRLTAIPDLLVAATSYFPFGAGLGTFDPIFRVVESLEIVSPPYFNHAHNDYFELLIEMGAFGIILPALFVIALGVGLARAWKGRDRSLRVIQFGSAAGLAIVLLHSFVDYPLRSVTIECVFALFTAILLVPDPMAGDEAIRRSPRPKVLRVVAGLAIAVAVVLGGIGIVRTQIARQAVLGRAGTLAYMSDPSNAEGTALAAEAKLVGGKPSEAIRLAREAIGDSPIQPAALRVLGQSLNDQMAGSGDTALLLAARMGWRDEQTQAWMAERAISAGAWRVAAARSEALARQDRQRTATYAFLSTLLTQPDARARLQATLAEAPSWRRQFLTNDDPRTLTQRRGMAALLIELSRTSNPPTIEEARPTIDGLVREDETDLAVDVLRAVAPDRLGNRDNLIADGGFKHPRDFYAPALNNTIFDWRIYDNGKSFADIERIDGNQALALGASFGDEGRLAEKSLALAPGRYRLAFRARNDGGNEGSGIALGLRCANGQALFSRPLSRLSAEWARETVDFVVPAQGCGQQVIGFAAGGVEVGTKPAAFVDDLVLRQQAAPVTRRSPN